MVFGAPGLVEVRLQLPVDVPPAPVTVAEQLAVPSETLTVPEGCPVDPTRATLTFTVYAWPTTVAVEPRAAAFVIVVVVLALLTVWLAVPELPL